MNFIMIGLLLREALDSLRVRLNMYLVSSNSTLADCVTQVYSSQWQIV